MTAKILTQFKQQVSSLELQPDQGGCFELTIGNELIYSKLETKEFPDEDQMIAAIIERVS
ncbi:MAG: SelT/SelW/SelH family protein [Planctomycetaceae bacterium]|nr:SelT/SelW/SelH family protein [Planctomycetaceae bacterium]